MAEKKNTKKEPSEHKSHSKKRESKLLREMKNDYWAISTVILAAILIVTLAYPVKVTGAVTSTISTDEIGQKVIDFANAQGAEAELISVEKNNSLFEVTLSIQGQEVPVYVTEDGKNLVPSLIPLEIQAKTPAPQATPAPANIPTSDKPTVEAFVMSHCPYGTQVEKGLLPVVGLLGDKINFDVKFVYYSMHPSQGEPQEQLNQYCIQEEQNDKYIDYLTCFLEAGKGAECLDEAKIDTDKMEKCVEKTDKEFEVTANLNDKSKWLNGRYPLFNIYKEDNEKYGVGGSPTLVINGVTANAGRDSASLLNAICASFNVAPEECETELPTAQPSPGFGWSTTQAAATAATCG